MTTPSGLLYSVDDHGHVTLLRDSLDVFAQELDLPSGEVSALLYRAETGGRAWAQ